MFRHLRDRIIISFCLLMLGGGALSTTLVSRNMSHTLGAAVDRSGRSLAQVLADQLGEPLAYGDRLAIRRLLTGARESNADLVYVFVTHPAGQVRDHSFAINGFPRDLLQIAAGTSPQILKTERGTVRDLAFPIAEGVLGTLHVGISMSWVDSATRDAVEDVLVTTAIAMLAGVLGILFLAHLITRPVLALREAADRLGEGDADAVVPVSGADELADLGRTFNRMAAQIRDRIAESEDLRAYVERVLDQMESSILVVSESLQVEYANRTSVQRHGEVGGRCCQDILSHDRPCDDCPVPEVLRSGSVEHRTYTGTSGRTYELKWVPIIGRDGQPAVVERALDVTERLDLQQRLQRAQRLAVAGEVAAGVVHSVNNPLDGVRRALDLAAGRPDDQDRVTRMLSLAREGTDRIAEITRTLLGFSRGDETPDPVPVQVDALVDAAISLSRLRAEAKSVRIRQEMGLDLPAVWVDPQGIVEVLVNLVLNAIDACEEGGNVTVRASVAAEGLRISVEDTGPGLSTDIAEKAFEPFFTTKDAAHGTGLGLPVARRVVEAHGGELLYEAGPSAGATFVVYLPLSMDVHVKENVLG